MRQQGPWSPELVSWVDRYCEVYDCVVGITYLYWTTWAALRAVRGRVPVVLHPTAHDESTFQLSLFDDEYRIPDAFALLAPEEAQLIRERFHFDPPGAVVGLGVEVGPADPARFRAAFGLGDRPYLLYAGRVDVGKNVRALVEMWKTFKARHGDDDLVLALVGDDILQLPPRDDLVVTGFVDTQMRDDALAGAFALAQPSMFESFSMILTEAFAYGRPALVEGKCAVLRGHAVRSGAAIPYDGYAEFEAALELLRAEPGLADAMGAAGRAYVEREYRWDVVLDRYAELLERTAGAGVAPA
jgi:glycosyltransferase involved in cell wall biosynthesis